MKPKIIINGIRFKNQKEAIDATRKTLLDLETIGEISPSIRGWDYLHALIERHPEYRSKKGCGISSFIIRRNHGNIALYIKRADTSMVDISWIICVKSKGASVEDNLISAMRLAIKSQIDDFKEHKLSSPVCGLCLLRIFSPKKDIHVHHRDLSFDDLAKEFIRKNRPTPTKFDDCPITHQAQFTKSFEAYSKRWQTYHLRNAKLVIAHSSCNLRWPRK